MAADRLAQQTEGYAKANFLVRVVGNELRRLDQTTPSGRDSIGL